MENKLKMELDALPTPATSFEELAAIKRKPANFPRKKKTALLIAAVLALILGGCVWAKESLRYGMWYIYGSSGWSDVERTTEKLDIVLPEELDGIPFDAYHTYALVPQEASRMDAYLRPAYRPYCVDYAVWDTTDITLPDGSSSTYTYTPENLDISFGTTENPLYRYYFNFDENDVWTDYDIPESYEAMEYQGITIQVGDTVRYDSYWERDVYTRWASWIDAEKKVAFCIADSDYTDPNRVLECAKVIIDLNLEQ